MRLALTALILALVAPAHAQDDPLRIAGGARTWHDAAHCSAYRHVWREYDWHVASIPALYEYGPQALLPVPPADDTHDPVAYAAGVRYGWLAQLNAAYFGRGEQAPSIGYDQLEEAFGIVYAPSPGGPRLPMPLPARGTAGDPVRLRIHRVNSLVWRLSWPRELSVEQLERIRAVLLRVPTCGGVAY
jgi:hypothetical protein